MLAIPNTEVKNTYQLGRYAWHVSLEVRLKKALKDAGLKQSDLARAVGVKRASVSAWFSGATKSLEGTNLVKAAIALRVSPEWLATGSFKKHLTTQEPPALYSLAPDQQTRLLALFDQLIPQQQQHFLREIEATVQANITTHKYTSERLRSLDLENTGSFVKSPPKNK